MSKPTSLLQRPPCADSILSEQQIDQLYWQYRRQAGEIGRRDAFARAVQLGLVQAADEHRKLQVRARDLQALGDTLIRTIGRDLANALCVIQGCSEVFVSSSNRCESNEGWRMVQIQAEAVREMVAAVKTFSGSTASARTLEPVSVRDAVAEVAVRLEKELDRKGIDLQYVGTGEVYVRAEREAFTHHVMFAAIENALKYSEPGGLVEVDAAAHGDNAIVEIRDHGRGIEEELLDGIFAFDDMRTRRGTLGETGLGFGLAVARLVTQLFGGEIHASAGLCGIGTKLTLQLQNADS